MRKLTLLILVAITVIACKKQEKKADIYEKYPEQLAAILKNHGGLDNWDKLQVLSFNRGDEVHTVDLHSRRTIITSPKYSLGFDGEKTWVSDTTAFKGNVDFYYNLYFYFYAMPFVLADDGITYSDTNPITYKGKEYPGVKISYGSGVGTSPDDNYYIFYDNETKQMEWLGYSVTYNTKKPTDQFNLIKYNKWTDVNGFKLPEEITWFKKDSLGNPSEAARAPLKFTLPLASQAKLAESYYAKPISE